jgi:thymidylate synthase
MERPSDATPHGMPPEAGKSFSMKLHPSRENANQSPITFSPLHFGDRLEVINPAGTVGIVTLWSSVDYVLRVVRDAGIDLSSKTSPVAAAGTLYGNGLREMLRNLLHNPQIDTLIVCGRDRSGSMEELTAFFERGVEPYDNPHASYEPVEGFGTPSCVRIRGTSRILDDLVTPALFRRPPTIASFWPLQDPDVQDKLRSFMAGYRPSPPPTPERIVVPLPRVRITSFPCNPREHTIRAGDPLTAWKDLIFTLHRFGVPVRLAKGERRELQNVKVIVEEPREIPEEDLVRWGYDPVHLRRYQEAILEGTCSEDETYSYGHRLRTYFGVDGLEEAARRLREDPEDRKAYVVLWDPRRDLEAAQGHPCLVSLFFRRFQERLTLTAVFRTHNALDAWLVNFYGLLAIQRHVASACGMDPGAVTVVSQSISLDTTQMDRAAFIAAERSFRYREDPMGYFRITVDEEAIVVEHRQGDFTLHTYRHPKSSRLQHEIARDCAVSDINHALYLGRQLARAEACLREGKPFVQE